MTAISSFRPLDDSEEIKRNQMRAKDSWNQTFDAVLYLNSPEARLWTPVTTFVESERFPKMSAMFLTAAMTDDIACVINADIVVGPSLKKSVENQIARGAAAIYSWRCEFDADNPNYKTAKQIDNGLDFFASYPEVWHMAARCCPEQFRLGHAGWDSWLFAFFRSVCGRFFVDISAERLIYHPKHGNRVQPHQFEIPQDIFSRGIKLMDR